MSAHSDGVVPYGNEVGGWVVGDEEDAAEAGEGGLKGRSAESETRK